MFKVTANSLTEYLNFDPERKADLESLDKLIRRDAPTLKRYFHAGTPAGDAGMRMKMIGYGKFRFANKSGKEADWPVIGVALQKSYISVYFAVTADDAPIVDKIKGKVDAQRYGRNNFSFVRFDDLNADALSSLVKEVAAVFKADPENAVRYRGG